MLDIEKLLRTVANSIRLLQQTLQFRWLVKVKYCAGAIFDVKNFDNEIARPLTEQSVVPIKWSILFR